MRRKHEHREAHAGAVAVAGTADDADCTAFETLAGRVGYARAVRLVYQAGMVAADNDD